MFNKSNFHFNVNIFPTKIGCYFKGIVQSKIKIISLITHTRRSKPLRASFIFGTQFKICLDEIRELSDPPIDRNATAMVLLTQELAF